MLTAAIFIPIVAAVLLPLLWRRAPTAAPAFGASADVCADPPSDGVGLTTGAVVARPPISAEIEAPEARSFERRLQIVATAVAAVPLLLLFVTWLRFAGTGTFELVEAVGWIPTLGVAYRVGVDGLSLPLAAMTALVFVAATVYPVDLRGRPRPYFALMLFLEGVSVGVFLALDLFLFFVF